MHYGAGEFPIGGTAHEQEVVATLVAVTAEAVTTNLA